MTEENKTSYKGTDKDGKCQGFQFEVGKEYKHKGDIKLCAKGFHACENPLDVFDYYSPVDSKFFEVEQGGNKESDAHKTVSSTIKIKAEIGLGDLIQAGVKFVIDICKTAKTNLSQGYYSNAASQGDYSNAASQGYYSTAASQRHYSKAASQGDYSTAASQGDYSTAASQGYSSKAASQGDYGKAASQGDYSTAASQGDYSMAASQGRESIACAMGIYSKAKTIDGWLIIVDWRRDDSNIWYINQICKSKVGGKIKGKKIQPDTWYWFEDGKLKLEKDA